MRVLLVEDDASLQQRLQTALGQAGFAVDVARNSVEAEWLGDTVTYDAVVLDLGLPGRSGLEVLQDCTLDEEQQSMLTPNGTPVLLTGMEFRLLRSCMLHPCQVLSRTRLAEHVDDWDTDHDSNVIEVYIKRLRHKCGKDTIQTRRGQGYVVRAPH